MTKQQLREKYKDKRAQLSENQIDEKSLAIANQLLKLDVWHLNYVHIFLPIVGKKEVNTEYILHVLQGKDKSILLPKANFKSGAMKAILLQENTVLKTLSHGITEPVDGIEVAASQIDLVFLPLLAYDNQGNRLGYGKGFYDKFLEQCSSQVLKIGLSFFPPEEETLPYSSFDIPMDYCVTPSCIFKF